MDAFDLFMVQILGGVGVILLFGAIVFVLVYKNSQLLFNWIEDRTYGTRDYILSKLEFLHISLKSEHVTYLLLFTFFGLPSILFCIFTLIGSLVGGLTIFIIFTLIGFIIPRPLINYMVKKRIDKYQTQMVDGLNLLTNGLRAGLSVPQSIGMVVDELPAPISQEFNIILKQNKIGLPLEECLEDLAKRVPTEDNQMFVSSINILRETGGNLAETFDTIVNVIRERIRLQQKIETYTARSMMQGYILFSMPFAMAVIYYVSDPVMMGKAMTSIYGILAFSLAFILDLIGGFLILKIVKIKV